MRKALKAFIYKIKEFLAQIYARYDHRLPYIITVVIALVLVVGGINLFVELTEALTTDVLAAYDDRVTDYFIAQRTPALTSFFVAVTQLGDLYGYLVVTGLMVMISYFLFRRWKYVAQTTIVIAVAGISNLVLKRFIDRARPGIEHLVSVETLSYPSGHAMSSIAFYGFLIYLFYKFKLPTAVKFGIITLLVFLILSIGISRIYLGVHFPSDVAGGFIAGFIWVVFCILLFETIDLLKADRSIAT